MNVCQSIVISAFNHHVSWRVLDELGAPGLSSNACVNHRDAFRCQAAANLTSEAFYAVHGPFVQPPC